MLMLPAEIRKQRLASFIEYHSLIKECYNVPYTKYFHLFFSKINKTAPNETKKPDITIEKGGTRREYLTHVELYHPLGLNE